jgi:transcriptional regulator of acetoin/glycerol metabolism
MTQATAASASTDRMIAAGANLEEMEQSVILKSLDAHGGNVSATARALGVSRNTIYRKVPHLK